MCCGPSRSFSVCPRPLFTSTASRRRANRLREMAMARTMQKPTCRVAVGGESKEQAGGAETLCLVASPPRQKQTFAD